MLNETRKIRTIIIIIKRTTSNAYEILYLNEVGGFIYKEEEAFFFL